MNQSLLCRIFSRHSTVDECCSACVALHLPASIPSPQFFHGDERQPTRTCYAFLIPHCLCCHLLSRVLVSPPLMPLADGPLRSFSFNNSLTALLCPRWAALPSSVRPWLSDISGVTSPSSPNCLAGFSHDRRLSQLE